MPSQTKPTATLSPCERAIVRCVSRRWTTASEVFTELHQRDGYTLDEVANAWWRMVRMRLVILVSSTTRNGYQVGIYHCAGVHSMVTILGHDETLDIFWEAGQQ